MSKRGENIHKRKDGRWEARYKKEPNSSGKTQYGSVYGKTYREAKEKQQEKRSSSQHQISVNREAVLFRDAAMLWLKDGRVRTKSATNYRYKNLLDKHIIPDLGSIRLDQMTATSIHVYLAGKLEHGRLDGKGGLSAAYVRSITLVIRSVMNYAASNHLCAPLNAKICKPVVPTQDFPILSHEEQKLLENACIAQMNETKIGILLSLYAGLRIGEVCALEWSDIDLKKKLIHVRKTVSRVQDTSADKGNGSILVIDRPKTLSSYRDIPLCSWLIPIVEECRSGAESGYVTSGCSQFISPRTYDYRYHKVLLSAGLPSIKYHSLRHTFATRCIEAGVDVKSLSEMLGHADASVTLNIYVHSSMERKRLQIENLRPE